MRPSRRVIEQRSRDYVVSYRDTRGNPCERIWSTHELAAKYARLMLEAGCREVAIDGRSVSWGREVTS